jgi:hypothetical protein
MYIKIFFGGQEKSLSKGRHRCGDALGRRHSFLNGIGCTPFFCAPPRTGGNPRTSLGSSVDIVASLPEGACLVCGASKY